MKLKRIVNLMAALLLAPFVLVRFVPTAMAWPYAVQVGPTTIHSESPIPPDIAPVLARSDKLLRMSPLNDPSLHTHLFLTNGGWRWKMLALRSSGAFAVRLPLMHNLVFNRADVQHDKITNELSPGGVRSLSGVIAHETTHILTARHFGELNDQLAPAWKREGYADFVAQESSLDEAAYTALKRRAASHPAILYYEGRKRVAAILAANGGSVDDLFRD